MFDVPPSRAQRGVALVVTLILLSIITFLTVAFLALSRRDKSSVTTSTDQIQARNMAEAALSRATADLLAGIIANRSLEHYGARVMTNYSNPRGFRQGQGVGNLTNVNFDLLFGATAPVGYLNLLPVQRTELLGNLLYDPRVPVLVVTNSIQGREQYDDRFYLDLNRNGRFDRSLPGLLGDPEWCAVFERSGVPHAGDNRAGGRYTFLVQPIGHSLDWNAIHNHARTRQLTAAGDGYWRNQNVATWELNYPGFLADLNTNYWGRGLVDYQYDPVNGVLPRGTAFEDAVQLLAYRYNGNYANLRTFAAIYPPVPPGGAPVQLINTDFIDGYSSGPLWTSLSRLAVDPDFGRAFSPWVGADNPNAFFSIQDVFDPAKVGPNFVSRLLQAGADYNNPYNAYTYYRMIQQIGTSSAPEQGKINLNYDSTVQGLRNPTFGFTNIASTNFLAWRPIDFFTNAAARLLAELDLEDATGNPITITNIPLYPINRYTPSVHQALQLAANVYDATTNRLGDAYPHMPTVFRPVFGKAGTNIFISGYVEELKNVAFITRTNRDLRIAAERTALAANDNVYGVPLVIGAKKGLPNFNEFSLQNVIDVSRRLRLTRAVVGGPVTGTNQQYLISIRHNVGIELWNSHATNYPKQLSLFILPIRVTMTLTNEVGTVLSSKVVDLPPVNTTFDANTWSGYLGGVTDASFLKPLEASTNFVDKQAIKGEPSAALVSADIYESGFPMPKLFLTVSANVQCLLADTATSQVLDYVSLAGLGGTVDIVSAAVGNYDLEGRSSLPGSMWISDRVAGTTSSADPPMGVINQLEVSKGNITISDSDWRSYTENLSAGQDRQKAIDEFRLFTGLSPVFLARNLLDDSKLVTQAPYTPTRKLKQDLTWQANDPLVHYLASDLTDQSRAGLVDIVSPPNATTPLTNNLGRLNPRYRPWGGNPVVSVDPHNFNLAVKDSLVRRSDDWNFPTNKFPNAGHLGRVHRGTPWQTVYLKSTNVTTEAWQSWTGNNLVTREGNNNRVDANYTRPVNDRRLFDIFTAAVNDNATLGQLSVNQTNAASWSAVLAGVVVLSNSAPNSAVLDSFLNRTPLPGFSPAVIAPAALDTNALPRIVNGIIRTRNTHNDREFSRPGDILDVPELTVDSPFLNLSPIQRQYGIPDTVYERIPEQIMGLLRSGPPRYVVYAYGQALKPAANSLVAVPGPQASLLCTNYQVTAEVALRAVVRVEGSPDPRNDNHPDPLRRYPPRIVIEGINFLPPD